MPRKNKAHLPEKMSSGQLICSELFCLLLKKNGMLLFISTTEIIFAGIMIVLLFGAKKVPEIARGLGKGIREFKNATSDIQEEIRKTSKEISDQADITQKKNSKPTSNSE